MFGRSTATFDRLIEKATSKLLLDPDWESILAICDNIRQGDVQPSYALLNIRKKIENENPHVSKFALMTLESVVKNCGSIVHVDVATRDFMEFMKDQARKRQDPVKAKIVELIQVWSHAFRNEPQYKVVQETFAEMKREGFVFPTLKESDAMFLSEKAPDWYDGECCHRCRDKFTMLNRKHHCRACGQIFCHKCSSKTSIVPKFGIEKEVRVCDACYETMNKSSDKKAGEDELPAEYLASSLAKQPQAPAQRTEQEIQEEEELQLALALSQSEQEAKEKERQRAKHTGYGSGYSSSSDSHPSTAIYAQPSKVISAPPAVIDTTDMDPELARYLNRNYWQQKSVEIKGPSNVVATTQPSAPAIVADSKNSMAGGTMVAAQQFAPREEERYQNGETGGASASGSVEEREQFLAALRSSIEIFVNRMRSNSQRGRSIANDSSVQTLFMTLNAMHPQLMRYIQEQEDQRAHYETLQDKLAQLKDARDALNVLRDEHRDKRRREQEELERLRQIQMAQKLEVLRQKKQEYLEYQRQLALQRMQEQEMEMRRRLELQKQEQQMRAMQYGFPQMYSTGQPGAVPSYGLPNEGSPHHQMHAVPGSQGQYYTMPQQQMVTSGMPPGSQMTTGIPQMYATTGGYTTAGGGYPQQSVGGYPVHSVPGGPTNYQPQQQQLPAGIPTQPGPMPNQPAPGQMYMPGPQSQPQQPGMDYNAYNMQAMANTLPQSGYMAAPGQYVPAPGQQQMGPPQGQMGVPQQQHQPGPNEQSLAQLISFD